VGDPRLDEPRRWGVVWIQHEAEELRVHHRATIPADEARALVVTLLASGRALQGSALGGHHPPAVDRRLSPRVERQLIP
jgi:hypothetical protein